MERSRWRMNVIDSINKLGMRIIIYVRAFVCSGEERK